MKLKLFGFENDIVFNEFQDTLFIIEDYGFYGNIIMKLHKLLNNEIVEDLLLLDDENKSIVKKCVILTNPFNIELNSKKVLTALYKQISKSINLQDEKKNVIMDALSSINGIIIDEMNDYNIDFLISDSLDIEGYLKYINLRIDDSLIDSPFKMLLNYFDILSEIGSDSILIVVGVFSYLSDDEIIELLKYKRMKGITALFIEQSFERNIKIKKYIIDQDYCEFMIQ